MRAWLPFAGLQLAVVLVLALPSGSCSSYTRFLNKKSEKFCQVQAECNAEIPCDLANGLDTGYTSDEEDCDFDAKAARDCLKGEWTCSKTFGKEFSYPIPPEACATVCKSVLQ